MNVAIVNEVITSHCQREQVAMKTDLFFVSFLIDVKLDLVKNILNDLGDENFKPNHLTIIELFSI